MADLLAELPQAQTMPKEQGATVDLLAQLPDSEKESPTVQALKSIALGGMQGVANLPVGFHNLMARAFQELPAGTQKEITGLQEKIPSGVFPMLPAGIPTRQAEPFTFAKGAPDPRVARVAEALSPLLTPTPEITGIARGAELAGRAIPAIGRGVGRFLTQTGARGAEQALTGAALAAPFAAEEPQRRLLPSISAAAAAAPLLGGALGAAGIGRKTLLGLLGKPLPSIRATFQPFLADELEGIKDKLAGGENVATADRTLFDKVARHYDELVGHSNDLQGNPITEQNFEHISPSNSISADSDRLNSAWDALGNPVYKRDAFDKSINTEVNKAQKGLSQYTETKLLKTDKENLVNRLQDFKNVRLNNFEDADQLKKDINQTIASIPARTATPEEKAFRSSLHNINEGVRQSVQDTAQDNPNLVNEWRAFDARFKNDVVPFRKTGKAGLSPFFKTYLEGGTNTDNFVKNYIKPGQNELLENFVKILPDNESRNLAAAAFFRGTENNPQAFLRKYKSLTERQRQLLLPNDKIRLDRLSKIQPTALQKIPTRAVKAVSAAAVPFPQIREASREIASPILTTFPTLQGRKQ